VGPNDRLFVVAVDCEREAAKPFGNTAELPVEPRLGEEPQNDAVRALKHAVLEHAGRCFWPAELSVERSHAPDVSADERDGADPCWKSHGQPAYSRNQGTFPDTRALSYHGCWRHGQLSRPRPATTHAAPMTAQNVLPVIDDPLIKRSP
jgi:hypothetical protein